MRWNKNEYSFISNIIWKCYILWNKKTVAEWRYTGSIKKNFGKKKTVELTNKKIAFENKLKSLKRYFAERKEIEASKREKI